MGSIQLKFLFLFILALNLPILVSAQEGNADELRFEVNKVYPFLAISKEKLSEAQTLVDLNPYFKPSWVKTYHSVEVLTTQQGAEKRAIGKSNLLTEEQKNLLNHADIGSKIFVDIQYLPDNNLSYNEVKEIKFDFTVSPEQEATFVGGEQGLRAYLKEKAIATIPDGIFIDYALAIVKFTISEEGEILNPHLFESSKDEATDQLLLETIRKMPCWKPASYANGQKVKQEFVLMVGNMENCNVNSLNIRRD